MYHLGARAWVHMLAELAKQAGTLPQLSSWEEDGLLRQAKSEL
jgi:hypothetical protein